MRAELAKPETWIEVAEVGDAIAGHVAFMPARTHPLGHGGATRTSRTSGSCSSGASSGARAPREPADGRRRRRGAARSGFRTMRLFTPEGQARARRFYEREGWAQHGEPFEAGLGIPLVEYRRELG